MKLDTELAIAYLSAGLCNDFSTCSTVSTTKTPRLDLTKVLGPVLKRLDDLEAELERALGRVEAALDDVLRAAEAVI